MGSEIVFEKLDPNNDQQAKAFVSWYKNPTMIKNWVRQKEGAPSEVHYCVEDFKKNYSEANVKIIAFAVRQLDKIIGYGQFYINHPVCMYKEGHVCWPSIGIGEDSLRGKGIGIKICSEVLRLAKEEGCTHIEAGIFQFNQPMKSILLQNNFELIGVQEKKTYVDGKWWNSEHYLLKL